MAKPLPLALIIDLDSTLANVEHREFHAKKKDWAAFHGKTLDDKPNEWCVEIVESLQQAHPDLIVFFITGRPEYVRPETETWLNYHMSPTVMQGAHLYMRPDDDYENSSTAEYKKGVYQEKIKGKYRVLFAIDDHVGVVKMWRSLGITTLDCEGNNY